MNVTETALKDIKPYEKNPRYNDQAVEPVMNSIREFGFRNPIIVDKDNVIVCGHTRYKAAMKLKLKTVPVIKADDLTEEQIAAYRLADNKVASVATWDQGFLSDELDRILKSTDQSCVSILNGNTEYQRLNIELQAMIQNEIMSLINEIPKEIIKNSLAAEISS